MTNTNYTHLLTIVDRSGSMFPIAEDMRGALNSFFAEQAKNDGACLVDYVQFDNQVEKVFEDKPVADARAVLEPRSSTALLDAIGKSVTELGAKFAGMSENERPGTVIVAVITDGMENSSIEWTVDAVSKLIKRQENEYNWVFTFLGANMDAVSVGSAMGFSSDSSMTYDTQTTGGTIAAMSAYTTRVRSGGVASYQQDEREAAAGKV